MTKIKNKDERKQAYEELDELIRNKQQKDQANKKSDEERIKDIRKTWPLGIRI